VFSLLFGGCVEGERFAGSNTVPLSASVTASLTAVLFFSCFTCALLFFGDTGAVVGIGKSSMMASFGGCVVGVVVLSVLFLLLPDIIDGVRALFVVLGVGVVGMVRNSTTATLGGGAGVAELPTPVVLFCGAPGPLLCTVDS
jgi:hypothetical protein